MALKFNEGNIVSVRLSGAGGAGDDINGVVPKDNVPVLFPVLTSHSGRILLVVVEFERPLVGAMRGDLLSVSCAAIDIERCRGGHHMQEAQWNEWGVHGVAATNA